MIKKRNQPKMQKRKFIKNKLEYIAESWEKDSFKKKVNELSWFKWWKLKRDVYACMPKCDKYGNKLNYTLERNISKHGFNVMTGKPQTYDYHIWFSMEKEADDMRTHVSVNVSKNDISIDFYSGGHNIYGLQYYEGVWIDRDSCFKKVHPK